jgi:hypothetical protein
MADSKLRRLEIKASEWLRLSEHPADHARGARQAKAISQLISQGKLCCLGLDALACGVARKELMKKGMPAQLDRVIPNYPWVSIRRAPWASSGRVLADTDDARDAAKINDNVVLTDAQKIKRLRPIFLRNGIRIIWRPNA